MQMPLLPSHKHTVILYKYLLAPAVRQNSLLTQLYRHYSHYSLNILRTQLLEQGLSSFIRLVVITMVMNMSPLTNIQKYIIKLLSSEETKKVK